MRMIPAPPGPGDIPAGPERPSPTTMPPPAIHVSAYLLDELEALKRTVETLESRVKDLESRLSRLESNRSLP